MPARILIVEDNPANLELMAYLLTAFGHTVLVTDDGVQAPEIAQRERPDLVICDLHMPGMDGFAVARILKSDSATRSIPLIAVTASAMVGDRDKVLAAGFDAYIAKPIDPEAFVPQIDQFLPVEKRSRPPQA